LKRVALELGGVGPTFVHHDADTPLDVPSSANHQVNGSPDLPAASRNCRFQFPTDCSDTFARRAASATLISPARIDNTIRVFSSAGNTGGFAMTIRFLRGQTRKKQVLPRSLTRDTSSALATQHWLAD
jgi:hypothetical protein